MAPDKNRAAGLDPETGLWGGTGAVRLSSLFLRSRLSGLLLSSPSLSGGLIVAASLFLRMTLHMLVRAKLNIDGPARPWLAPLREIVCFGVWAASLAGSNVRWRERDYSVLREGVLALKDA